jgi:hypothetical protein
VNSYNINRNRRKHVLEIGGTNFSTLLVALGAIPGNPMLHTLEQTPMPPHRVARLRPVQSIRHRVRMPRRGRMAL